MIDLSKLLQVVLAFVSGGQAAYNKKSSVLKYGTAEYNAVTNFIQNNTTDTILYLYLLFLRLEQARNASTDGRTPIVYYALDIFARYRCDKDSANILSRLDTSNQIDKFVELASKLTKYYLKQKQKMDENMDYNHLIKVAIDYNALDDFYEIFAE